MKKNPFFSILSASLNNGSSIRQTIESIRCQTFQSLEHIVIDGKSQDTTCDILREYENTYKLCWLSEPDKGIADALNKGLKKSRGKYIVVIQADDYLLNPNILKKVHTLLKNEKNDIISFPVVLNHPVKGKSLRKPIRFLWWNHFKFIFLHQGCFVHRRMFERIGGFRNEFKIGMDYDFFYRTLAGQVAVKFGNFPVSLMGGAGVGSDTRFIIKRLSEEKLVQMRNEQNPGWKIAQFLFRWLYMHYKKFRLRSIMADKFEAD